MESGNVQMYAWIGFNVLILVLLAVDLLVFHRKAHEVRMREAVGWSVVWVTLGLAFTIFVYFHYDHFYDPAIAAQGVEKLGALRGYDAALKYLADYLIEKSLSVDNLFVFLLVFRYFAVPAVLQHRVLFWGIIGALIFRAIFIFAGVALIHRFEWMIYIFGAFLVFTGIRMAMEKEKEIHPERNPMLVLLRKVIPVTGQYHGQHFFIRDAGKLVATPMLVTLLVIETTDIVFAVDSIPAILAITADPFIVYTSNVFAILGLRALFFALAAFMTLFGYLHYGLSAVLVFVGVKMLAADFFKVPILLSLSIIFVILAASVIASILFPPKDHKVEQIADQAEKTKDVQE
jgi:tellurite resistance protein TerC